MSASREDETNEPPRIVSEDDPDAGSVSTGKDLAVALGVGALGILAMGLALAMPNTEGNVFTAPGFMPFLTGFCLLVMAAGLWVNVRRRGLGEIRIEPGAWVRDYLGDAENQWVIILTIVVAAYVALLDWITFEVVVPLGFVNLAFGTFEAVTIPVLAVVLRMFWRKPFLSCLLVSAVATLVLAAAFRYGFRIPLPGSG